MNTSNNRPQVGLLHLEVIDRSNFSDFEREVDAKGLDFRIESRPESGPYAGIEWLIPTAIVVYIGKAYFESFLKEAGKDHYAVLKAAIIRLSSKFSSKDEPKGYVVFSKDKAKSGTPKYSIFYSIVANLGDGFCIKLLLQNDFDASTCNAAQEAFLQFLSDLHDGHFDPTRIQGLVDAKPLGNILLLAYEPEGRRLQVIDPLAGKRADA
ncbi:hypothetical protein FKV24_003785 [Lysobacter maris]|uniref:Uncharacterized protein n=1 Tax=Marilutibacter maris TaxID=1605891 RepID=A0A508B038_9GAMM|nr:hypothetical protein [Lysobacter maris]KAB8198106.1 hypothetical protein FKV24_003785 [Lysobacter maris]